jgi:tetratricopeptide (TPR) repeat protein
MYNLAMRVRRGRGEPSRRRRAAAAVMRARVCAFMVGMYAASLMLSPGRARANDFEEFEAARSAYDSQDYGLAAKRFEALGGGDTPALANRSLLLESKKYLGASYLFLGKLQRAEAEFERLLRLDPQYVLDPLGFPEDVQRLFAKVKTRLDAERRTTEEQQRRESERVIRLQSQRQTAQQQRWTRLTELAETEHVTEVRSRWVALMPFGIGQVQNGHGSLGAILAVSESSLLLIGFVSWLVHEDLRGQNPIASQRDEFSVTERVARYTNQVSMGLFGALAITGIIDAQVRFEGDHERTRKRSLPAELTNPPPELSIGGEGLRLRWKF